MIYRKFTSEPAKTKRAQNKSTATNSTFLNPLAWNAIARAFSVIKTYERIHRTP